MTTGLELEMETERTEKTLLRERLTERENELKRSLKEVEDFKDRYRKKQESYLQLQNEKEQDYSEASEKFQQQVKSKESLSKELNTEISRLGSSLDLAINERNALQAQLNQTKAQLESKIDNLKVEISNCNESTNRLLEQQRASMEKQFEEKRQEVEKLLLDRQDLELQRKELQNNMNTTLQELTDARRERDCQIQELQQANKLATTRKTVLDELAIKYQEQSESHRKVLKELEEKYENNLEQLDTQLQQQQILNKQVEPQRIELAELRSELKSVEITRDFLKRRVEELEEKVEETRQENERVLTEKDAEHESEKKRIEEESSFAISNLEADIIELKEKVEDAEEERRRLQQDIKDGLSDRKLQERKGTSLMKDLKRQLHSERNKVEKLQKKLSEVLSEHSKSNDELLHFFDNDSNRPMDVSSVSSWSASHGQSALGSIRETKSHSEHSGISRQSAGVESGSSSDQISSGGGGGAGGVSSRVTPPGAAQLEEENFELQRRMCEMQESCWALEEKVKLLEESNGAMAEDILQKQSVIEHYCMKKAKLDTRSNTTSSHSSSSSSPLHFNEKITMRKIRDFVKIGADENLRDINRKLQRLLEEALTKNMHLEQNLQMISTQLPFPSSADDSSNSSSANPTCCCAATTAKSTTSTSSSNVTTTTSSTSTTTTSSFPTDHSDTITPANALSNSNHSS